MKFFAKPAAFFLIVVIMGLLARCDIAADTSGSSRWKPKDYFEGPAADMAEAAMKGDAKEIKRLMKEEGVNPDTAFSKNGDGMPLLAWPILTKSPAGLEAMLENGANPNARFGSPKVTVYADGNKSVYQKNNAMVMAAGWPDPIYLKLLLKHGGDPKTHNSNDDPLLSEALLKGPLWENIQILVLNGADVNETQWGGGTILGHYADIGAFDKAYWLLQHGADPTVRTYGSMHPPEGTPWIVHYIYWGISSDEMIPWQRKCQHWLRDKGIQRSEVMPEGMRSDRKDLGFPYEEKDIPLL
jgi:uncharacterized protein